MLGEQKEQISTIPSTFFRHVNYNLAHFKNGVKVFNF